MHRATRVRRIGAAAAATAIGFLGLAVIAPSVDADVPAIPKTMVSVNAAGTDGGYSGNTGTKTQVSVSADGTKVAWASLATNLTATADTNGLPDVFVRDLTTNTTELVSVNAAGTDTGSGQGIANQGSLSPQLSADGTAVVFLSDARDLVAQPLGNFNTPNLYVRDLVTHTTKLVNIDKTGTAGSDSFDDYLPAISADGSKVVFQSDADDLVALTTTGNPQVFVRNVDTGTTTLVSVKGDGTASTVNSASHPDISADGTKVAFLSGGADLASPPSTNGGGGDQVWVRDLAVGTNTLVSHKLGAATTFSNGGAQLVQIDDDGAVVAFESNATDLTGDTDTNGAVDIYAATAGTTTLMSKSPLGAGTPGPSHDPQLSGDGNSVAFESSASDLVPNLLDPTTDTNGGVQDVFVSNRLTGGVPRLASRKGDGTGSGNGSSGAPSVDRDGTRVSFVSNAPDLTDPANLDQGSTDLFMYEPFISKVSLVSDGSTPDGVGDGDVSDNTFSLTDRASAIAANGAVAAFMSFATDYGLTDTNNAIDVFEADLHNQIAIQPIDPVTEGNDHVTVTLTRSGSNGSKDTVGLHTVDGLDAGLPNPPGVTSPGAATAPDDYTARSVTIVWNPGEITRTVDIPIIDDGDSENHYELFRVVVDTPTGAARLPSPSQAYVTIVDNDSVPPANTDVGITKTGAPNPVPKGQLLTYAITVANQTAGGRSGVVTMTDTIPLNTAFVSLSGTFPYDDGTGAEPGAACATPTPDFGGTITCTGALDGAGGAAPSTVFTLVVKVAKKTTATSVSNTATVSLSGDPNSANDSAKADTNLSPGAPSTTSTTTPKPPPCRPKGSC
jgi:uncharacterized repeat protein (TIGR01451 family)